MNLFKERPIILNTEMVRAVLDGRKTQTRRPVSKKVEEIIRMHAGGDEFEGEETEVGFLYGKYSDDDGKSISEEWLCYAYECPEEGVIPFGQCPLGKIGDQLWVRETLSKEKWPDYIYNACPRQTAGTGDEEFNYRGNDYNGLVPSIFMPRWASRIQLEITNVRVERVQEISEEDAIAEGCDSSRHHSAAIQGFSVGAKTNFRHLWQQLYGDSWDCNQWVWVIDFKLVTR